MYESFLGMRSAQKFFKNQIQIFQIVLNNKGLWHVGANNIVIPRQRNKSTRSTRFLPRQRQGDFQRKLP